MRERAGALAWNAINACCFAALLSVAFIATSPCAEMRTNVIFAPYAGGSSASVAGDDLRAYLQDSISTSVGNLSTVTAADYLNNLSFSHPTTPLSAPLLRQAWSQGHALLVVSGLITTDPTAAALLRSSLFTGDLTSSLPGGVPLVSADTPLSIHEYPSLADLHSAATLLALAVDAKAAGLPQSLYLRYSSEALGKILDAEKKGEPRENTIALKCMLISFVSSSTMVPTISGAC